MVSFVITQIRFKSSNKVLGLFVIGMLIPAQVLIIPISIMAKYMDGYNNLPFLICVYIATGMPYMIFVICGFMKNLPKELMEAGLIDGCNGLKTFTKIVVPLSRPAIATMGMLSFIGTWNEMIIALILLKKNELKNSFAGIKYVCRGPVFKFSGDVCSRYDRSSSYDADLLHLPGEYHCGYDGGSGQRLGAPGKVRIVWRGEPPHGQQQFSHARTANIINWRYIWENCHFVKFIWIFTQMRR